MDLGQLGGGSGRSGGRGSSSRDVVHERINKQINTRFSPLIKYLEIFETRRKKECGGGLGSNCIPGQQQHHSPLCTPPLERGLRWKPAAPRSCEMNMSILESSVINVRSFHRVQHY